MDNVNPKEVANFDSTAAEWWQPEGAFKALHDINPVRLTFITSNDGFI